MNGPALARPRSSAWSALFDRRRVRAAEVLACLRRLAGESAEHLLANGPAPVMTTSDAACLRPFLGRVRFTRGMRAAVARRVNAVLLLAPKAPRIGDNDIAVLVDRGARRSGPLARLRERFLASRSSLVEGRTFLSCFEEVATADPAFAQQVVALARAGWRRRTIFHPDEPAWPDALSVAAWQFLLVLALDRPGKPGGPRAARGGHRAFVAHLVASLPEARQALAARPEAEQMIVADAALATLAHGPRAAHRHVAQLPICRLAAYASLRGSWPEEGSAAGRPGDDAPAVGVIAGRSIVERLGAGQL